MRRGGLHFTIAEQTSYLSAEFEVFGKVQGVYFRKYAKLEADKLGVVGWIMNGEAGTVVGVVEGGKEGVNAFIIWLKTKGSPESVIKKAVVVENWFLPNLTYTEFSIRMEPPDSALAGTKLHLQRSDESVNDRVSYLRCNGAQARAPGGRGFTGRHPTNYIRPKPKLLRQGSEDGAPPHGSDEGGL